MSTSGVGATVAIQQPIDIGGMDLETAMMAVQSNRAILEAQLKDQIASVQKKNDTIAQMNALLGQLNGAAAKFDSGATASTTKNLSSADMQAMQSAADSAGMKLAPELAPSFTTTDTSGAAVTLSPGDRDKLLAAKASGQATVSVAGKTVSTNATLTAVAKDLKKSDIDTMVQSLKSQIDGLSNSQQMDMLRLQSLSNKRNEAFEIMTNFMKKMADNRSSIVGNMR